MSVTNSTLYCRAMDSSPPPHTPHKHKEASERKGTSNRMKLLLLRLLRGLKGSISLLSLATVTQNKEQEQLFVLLLFQLEHLLSGVCFRGERCKTVGLGFYRHNKLRTVPHKVMESLSIKFMIF